MTAGIAGDSGGAWDDPDVLARRALQSMIGVDRARFGLTDIAQSSGIDPERLREYWRALGFPDPRPGEKLFGAEDVEMLATVVGLINDGNLEPEAAKQIARVIGSSLDRVAAAQIDAFLRTAALQTDEEDMRRSLDQIALDAPHPGGRLASPAGGGGPTTTGSRRCRGG